MIRSLSFALTLSAAVLAGAACSSSNDLADDPAGDGADSSAPTTPGNGGGSGSGSGSESDGEPTTADAASDADTSSDAGAAGDADAASGDSGPPAFTQAEVQALFNAKCRQCHTSRDSIMVLVGDFTLTTVNVDSRQVPSMKRILPGNKARSYLFHKLSATHTREPGGFGNRMPPLGARDGQLTADDILRIGKYIDAL